MVEIYAGRMRDLQCKVCILLLDISTDINMQSIFFFFINLFIYLLIWGL